MRHILHIDADAFFASVEQILNPTLKGKPLLVGGPSEKHGIVSAASYEARAFGIHSGMPMYLAKKKCPQAVVMPANFGAYRDFSKRMYQLMTRYSPVVEMASVDEAYVDISGCEEMHGASAHMIARRMLEEIYKRLGLSVSCGLASSRTVAKVASSTNKPHKLTVVPYGKEMAFLAPLSLRAMPGIGPKTFQMLEKHGFLKIGDLNALDLDGVLSRFGVSGIPIWKRTLGIDNSEVVSTVALPKSISKEHTFYSPDVNISTCLRYLKHLSAIVFSKLRSHDMRAGTIFVKVRYREYERGKHVFRDFGFQRNVDVPSALDHKLFPMVKELFLANVEKEASVRLIGVGVGKLLRNYNLTLFDGEREKEKLFFEIDAMKKVYGEGALRYGA